MKIELKYDGKNYYDPQFILLWNIDKTKFAIGICPSEAQDYKIIINDMNHNFEKCITDNKTTFYYYTKENVYVFNFKDDFKIFPVNREFEHSIVLLDKDDKIIEDNYLVFKATLNGNSDK